MEFRRAYGLPGFPASFNSGTLFFVVVVGVVAIVVVVVGGSVVVVVDTIFGPIDGANLTGFFNRVPVILTLFPKHELITNLGA